MPNDYTPFQFQLDTDSWLREARDNKYGFSCEANCGLVGHEMGLGKTAIALRRLRTMVESGKRFLILAPGATIIQWQRNWDRWILDCEPDDFGLASLHALRSSTDKIPCNTSCVASHQMMTKADFIESAIAANFDGLILDEAHKFGGRNTKRIKHLWALRNCSTSHFESARILLTGTPVRNYADEIYNLLHFVAPHNFRNFEDFARKYLTRDNKALWNPMQFHRDIEPFYIRKTVAEVQKDLPPLRTTKLYCEVTDPFLKAAYNKELDALENLMEKGALLRNAADESDSGPQSLLGYLVKLRHITGVVKAREAAIVEPIAEFLLAENQRNGSASTAPGEAVGNKIAIGIIHRLVADRLERSLRNEVADLEVFRVQGGMTPSEKDAQIRAFQASLKPSIILMNMEAGGAGIDGLQLVCSRSAIFERMWNGADEEQFAKRIRRTGQKYACEMEITMAKGTVDEFFDNMVDEKNAIAGTVGDVNWEAQPHFIKELAARCVISRL